MASLALVEVALRVTGHEPWTPSTLDAREPIMNQPDPVRGWRNRPGRYVIPPYGEGGHETGIRIGPGGGRATGPDDSSGRRGLVLVGGSYTRGNGLSDDETTAWKLQRRFPELQVMNHGTGGYGTYQSLLVLEELLPKHDVAFVLYGFIDHHEVRNVAPPEWIDLLSRFSRRRHVAVPYCSLGANGELVRHSPEAYPVWPLRRWLATVAFLERVVAYSGGGERIRQRRPVTELLLVEMESLTRRHGGGFAVVFLTARRNTIAHYARFLRGRGIRFADCAHTVSPRFQVPGEGHPNDRLTSIWTDCVDEKLGDALRVAERRAGSPRDAGGNP